MSTIRYAAKAWVAAIVAGLSSAIPLSDNGFTEGEWLLVALAFTIGFQSTYWTENRDDVA